MARRKRKRMRQPPNEVELAARRAASPLHSFCSTIEDGDDLKLDDAIAEQVAVVQRGWDEDTTWLRGYGINECAA